MKRIHRFSIFGAVLALAAIATADDASTIRATYAKLSSALGSTNFDHAKGVIMSISTRDFVYYDSKGKKQTGEQVLAEMKQQISMTRSVITSSMSPGSIKVSGNRASVHSTGLWKGRVIWTDKKEHTLVSQSSSVDTLVKVGGQWKFAAVHEKTDSYTLDGKPFKM